MLQLIVFPIGMLYFLLHVGPLLQLWYTPSIQGGTRWKFFASELVVFTLWLLGSPVLWASELGRLAILAHMSMHTVFTILDYVAHDFLLGSALAQRSSRPAMWVAKWAGLVLDTATHAIAVTLVALTLPVLTVLILSVPSLLAYAWVTRGYLQRYST